MATVKVYNLDGTEAGSIDLDDKVFAQKAKPELIYQVVRVARANIRQPLAHTKMRGEVRGGGKKPWQQKGTGRARHGSTRSPIWKGGGVTFGPRAENIIKLAIPAKMRKKALCAIISQRVEQGGFIVVDSFLAIDKPSTKKVHEFFKKLKIASKKILFLSDKGMDIVIKSLRNIPNTKSIRLENINILDVMSFKTIIISKDSVQKLSKQMGK